MGLMFPRLCIFVNQYTSWTIAFASLLTRHL
uniref:ENTH domain-containing protein n=1 Tax=Rhizophora mucronata TaxID=61149 RepID=A0A2P2P9A2_RHIMU